MRVILMLLLIVVSSSAMAEWDKVATDVNGDTYYADFDTIRKSGNMVKMWVMEDLRFAEELDVLSARHKEEFDCNKKQYRRLFTSLPQGRCNCFFAGNSFCCLDGILDCVST